MVTTEEMIKRMNAMDGMEEAPTQEDEATLVEDGDGELPPTEKNAGSVVGTIEGVADGTEPSMEVVPESRECPELEDQGDEESDDEGDNEEEEESEDDATTVRRSERIQGGIAKPERYAVVTKKIKQTVKHDKQTGEALKQAKIAEIRQVFDELQALQPVEKSEIPANVKPLGSHLFTVEKFLATGQHDKYKSQIVSHGNEQDTLLYLDRSSPTAVVHTIMTALTIAACNKDYALGKVDIKGTFIQTEMSGMPVYIKCRGQLKELIHYWSTPSMPSSWVRTAYCTASCERRCTAVYRRPSCGTKSKKLSVAAGI